MSIELDFNSDDVLILDNLLSEGEVKSIYDSFFINEFPWYFMPSTCTKESLDLYSDENTFEGPQFTSLLYADFQPISTHWDTSGLSYLSHRISEYLGYQLQYKRVKVNLQLSSNNEKTYNLPHKDFEGTDHLVMIYYVNSTDGPTTIFKNEKSGPPWEVDGTIECKAGRLIIFSGNKYHAGIHPKNDEHRIVVNFNITNFQKIQKEENDE